MILILILIDLLLTWYSTRKIFTGKTRQIRVESFFYAYILWVCNIAFLYSFLYSRGMFR